MATKVRQRQVHNLRTRLRLDKNSLVEAGQRRKCDSHALREKQITMSQEYVKILNKF